jgi:hypothetical protein
MTTAQTELTDTRTALFHQTVDEHHAAYQETDGVDPDWSIWYAGRLLEHGFDTLLHASIVKSDLIYLLVTVDKQQLREAPRGQWERSYTDFFLQRYRTYEGSGSGLSCSPGHRMDVAPRTVTRS